MKFVILCLILTLSFYHASYALNVEKCAPWMRYTVKGFQEVPCGAQTAGFDESSSLSLPEEEPKARESHFSEFASIAIGWAKELKDPVSAIMLDNETLGRNYIYAGVSSALLSLAIRQLTGNMLNFNLIASQDADNRTVLSGVGVGVKPTDFLEVKTSLQEEENSSRKYSLEVGLYPDNATKLILTYEDNETERSTGIKLQTIF